MLLCHSSSLFQHKALVAEREKWEQSGKETATLEKIVLKLRGQLKGLERVDLERQELAMKVKAAEEEIKEKVCCLLSHET